MSDYSLLKAVAESAEEERLDNNHRWPEVDECDWFDTSSGPDYEYLCAASPMTILGLIAENESLRKDAERFKWLNRQRSQVWRMLAEMPMNHTAPYIDAAISSPENPS